MKSLRLLGGKVEGVFSSYNLRGTLSINVKKLEIIYLQPYLYLPFILNKGSTFSQISIAGF